MAVVQSNTKYEHYSEELCKKISRAIKQSGIYSSINPADLIKKKIREDRNKNSDYTPPEKKLKGNNETTAMEIIDTSSDSVFRVPDPPKSTNNTNKSNRKSIVTDDSMECSDIDSIQILSGDESDISKTNETSFLTGDKSKSTKNALPPPDEMFNTNKSSENTKSNVLPSPDEIFADKTENPKTQGFSSNNALPSPSEIFSDKTINPKAQAFLSNKNKLPDPNSVFEGDKANMFKEKVSTKTEVKEKPKSKLSSLASAFLPAPNQIFTKSNIIEAIKIKNHAKFTSALKTVQNLDKEFSNDDVYEMIQKIIDNKFYSVIPELCIKFKNQTMYINAFTEQFIKNMTILMKHKNEFLNCIESMIDANSPQTIHSYIKACVNANEWNSMLKCVFEIDKNFKLDDEDFNVLISIFQNYMNRSIYFSHDTVGLIISYIIRHYKMDSESYMADVWIYCMYHDILNPESGETNDIPETILDKVIYKLTTSKNPSYVFAQKLLLSNLNLLKNTQFTDWLAHLISEKTSDIKKNMTIINDAISQHNHPQLSTKFYFLAMNVIRYLNKKCLFTLSYTIYESYVKQSLSQLTMIIDSCDDKFKYKWCITECMIAMNKNEEALYTLQELHALEDIEEKSEDYISAKKTLPTLINNLLGSNLLDPTIDLYQKVVSIFVLSDKIEIAYVRHCNQLFDNLVKKAYDKPNEVTMKKLIDLVQSITSWEIKFTFTSDILRKLLNSSLECDVAFESMIEFLEFCQSKNILPNVLTNENRDNKSGGTTIDVPSFLTQNEISIWIAWIVRCLKIRLVELAQSDKLAEHLTRICSLTFQLKKITIPNNTSNTSSNNANFQSRDRKMFLDFIDRFTRVLSQPKYLSSQLQFTILNKASEYATIVLDSKSLYNAIYYSDL